MHSKGYIKTRPLSADTGNRKWKSKHGGLVLPNLNFDNPDWYCNNTFRQTFILQKLFFFMFAN